jgi:hypothetical protein
MIATSSIPELDEATADAIGHAVLHKAMSDNMAAERAGMKSQYDKVGCVCYDNIQFHCIKL